MFFLWWDYDLQSEKLLSVEYPHTINAYLHLLRGVRSKYFDKVT